ncbi:MAG: TM2 domain-containing protein [Oscillospiraceae bacterium]
MNCPSCGAEAGSAAFCPNCGNQISQTNTQNAVPPQQPQYQQAPYQQVPPQVVVNNVPYPVPMVSPKSRTVALILCIFLGYLGIHRFYAGKVGTGILWLLTAGCFGIGAFVDLIIICVGSFKDGNGFPILNW